MLLDVLNILHVVCFFSLLLLFMFPGKAAGNINGNAHTALTVTNGRVKDVIGAIVNNSSRIGKEEQVAMEMAVQDFNSYTNQTHVLHIRNSQGEPVIAALAAMDLISVQNAQAIVGPQTWEEVSVVAQVCNEKHIPVLSLADSAPGFSSKRWPFLLAASPNQLYAQMQPIAAIVESWEWTQVTAIYEDIDSSATGVIPHLSDALKEKGVEIVDFIVLPPFASSTLSKELRRLQEVQCRVFVVHLSVPMAVSLFETAKKMNMMEEGYVWIATDPFTSLLHSIDAFTLASIQGILGVKRYFPENGSHFKNFSERFRKSFTLKYPEEENSRPGIHALQAYDAVWAVCKAMKESKNGRIELLEKILLSDFHNQTAVPPVFQIVNVRERSFKELGFWSNEFGFQETIDQNSTYNSLMKELGQVFWPGGTYNTPKGWTLPTTLRIGVPTRSLFKQYVNVEDNPWKNETTFSGIAIELFREIVKEVPFDLPYKFYPFNGTYTDLVRQIHLKNFDAAVGDIAITATLCKYSEFTPPYTESGLVMVVPLQPKSHHKEWLFIKPFTKALWILIATITIYNGFAVWLIERHHCSEPPKSPLNQTGTLLCFSFTTLVSVRGSILHSNLSRMIMVIWLFVALIIMRTYTAKLASILTGQRLEPMISSVEALQKNNAMVGHSNASFVSKYLADVLHFKPKNMKGYTSPDAYARDLKNGDIAAIFLEAPVANLFLAIYCKRFTIAGPTYKVGGYAFAFPRGSQLLPSITEALLNVSESGKLRNIEKRVLGSEHCTEVDSNDEISSLSARSFFVLFVLTSATSTFALIVYVTHYKWKTNQSDRHGILLKAFWKLMFVVTNQWRHHRRAGIQDSNRKIEVGNANMGIGSNIEVLA